MLTTKLFADGFSRNHLVIEAQTEGISHQDALTQTPYNVNCLNWVLGHIADSRDRVLEILGRRPLLTAAEGERYRRDSEPVTGDGPDVVHLSRLLEVRPKQADLISPPGTPKPECIVEAPNKAK